MTLLVQAPKRVINSTPIVLLNTCPDADAVRALKPMPTREMTVLEQSLHMAGLLQSEVTIINLFPSSISTEPFWHYSKQTRSRYFKPAATPWLERMDAQLTELAPKVVVGLGEIPVRYLLKRYDYTKIRGYPFQQEQFLVIPSLAPRDMVWSNYVWRFYLSSDLNRAKEFANGALTVIEPELVIPQSFSDAKAILEELNTRKALAFDIEVSNHQVSCIGYSDRPHYGVSIPIDNRWTEEQEITLWCLINKIQSNLNLVKIAQNGLFDCYFLAMQNNIITEPIVEDTMVAHSIAFPDFLKGLGFLGSIHTTYTYWKDQMQHESFKEEA